MSEEFTKANAEQLIFSLSKLNREHSAAVFRHAIRKVRKLYDIPDPYKPDGSPVVFISTIVKVVSTHYAISVDDILSHKMSVVYTTPRHVIYFLAFVLSNLSKVQIGKKLNNRDHTTIIWGIKKIQKRIAESEQMEELIDYLIEKCLDAASDQRAENIRKMQCQTIPKENYIS